MDCQTSVSQICAPDIECGFVSKKGFYTFRCSLNAFQLEILNSKTEVMPFLFQVSTFANQAYPASLE